jgi:glucosamine-phosphate N-acetyltransferase
VTIDHPAISDRESEPKSLTSTTITTNHSPSTHQAMSTPLFPASLIPSSASSSLPQNYVIRPLQRSDFSRGFLKCLTDLTWIGEISESAFEERYDWMATKGKEWYYCIVIDDGERIVATATMIVERKL